MLPVQHQTAKDRDQTETFSDQLVNIVHHLAAKKPDVFLRLCWSPKTELQHKSTLDFVKTGIESNRQQFAIMFAIKAWDVKTQVLCLKVFSFLIKWNIVHFNHVVSFLSLINPQRSDCNGHMDKFGSPHLTQKSCQCGIMAWELLLPSGNSSEAQFFFIPLAVTLCNRMIAFCSGSVYALLSSLSFVSLNCGLILLSTCNSDSTHNVNQMQFSISQ